MLHSLLILGKSSVLFEKHWKLTDKVRSSMPFFSFLKKKKKKERKEKKRN